MGNSRLRRVLPLVGWTVFLWSTRLRNAWTDEDLSGGDKQRALIVGTVFVAMAVGTGILVWLRRSQLRVGQGESTLFIGFAAFTIGYWLIRAVEIATADHDLAFIVVHVVLGGGSIVASAFVLDWLWRGAVGAGGPVASQPWDSR